MDTNVNYTIVGAFVISLLVAIVLAVIWISSGFSFERYSTYVVYMQESVAGLNIDAPVEYNGVNVGEVKSIDLDTKNPHLVKLLLNIKLKTPVTKGTVATLNTRGITGITYIALKDKSTDLRPLVALRGQPYPVIPTAPSLFVRLDTALTQFTNNFDKVARSVQNVLDRDNQLAIKDTLNNLKKVTNTLARNSNKLNSILRNTSQASRQLTPLVRSSMGTFRTLESQTLPELYRLLANLDEITRNLSQVSFEISKNPSILIRGVANQKLGPGETR